MADEDGTVVLGIEVNLQQIAGRGLVVVVRVLNRLNECVLQTSPKTFPLDGRGRQVIEWGVVERDILPGA